jgi:hypothetical protein
MIWKSTALMTIFDILIVGAALFACYGYSRHRLMLKRIELHLAMQVILVGICLVGLFHLADLCAMILIPLYATHTQAMEVMTSLHLYMSWIEKLFFVIFVAVGITYFINEFLPRIISKLEMRISELEAVQKITQTANSSLESENLFREIIQGVRRVISCEYYLIGGFENGIQTGWYIESKIKEAYDDESNVTGHAPWIREVYEKKHPVNVPNLHVLRSSEIAKELAEAGFQSMIAVPILQDTWQYQDLRLYE